MDVKNDIAIGVMVVPSNGAYRAAARQTWMIDANAHANVRFVAGDVPCAHAALDGENSLHGDITFVQSADCERWHSPAKINAWYTFALLHYPAAKWIAKMEDDGMLWVSAREHNAANEYIPTPTPPSHKWGGWQP